jgi:hypothetical protein
VNRQQGKSRLAFYYRAYASARMSPLIHLGVPLSRTRSGRMEMSRPLSLPLCGAAENVEPAISRGVNILADQVAAAMKRATLPDTGSAPELHPIATAPRDGRFLILKEDASGKFNIARWAPEAGEWVRENDQPIKITPAYWYPIREQNDFQTRLDRSTGPSEPEQRVAPQRHLGGDVLASRSDAASPDTVLVAKADSAAVEAKRASARNRFAAFLVVASFVVAIGVGMNFHAEVTSYVARHTVGDDLFGHVIGQVTQLLRRNLEVSLAQMSQGQHGPQVDAPAPQIAMLQHQDGVGGTGAQAPATTPAKSATSLEPAAINVEHTPALAAERDRGPALLSKATGDAAQLKQAAEATAAELQQSLVEERDRVAALVRELAMARSSVETEVALSHKSSEEAQQLRQAAKTTTGELEAERNRSATLARDLESAQRMLGARSTTERLAANPIMDSAVAEQLRRGSRATSVKDNPDAARLVARASSLLAQGSIGAARLVLEQAAETANAQALFALAETYDPNVLATWRAYGTQGDARKARDLYARAYEGGIKAAKNRSRALVTVEGHEKPASWFGREEAD